MTLADLTGPPFMIQCDHRFVLLYLGPDGRVLGQRLLTPNWEPAFEWAAFTALRAGYREAWANGRVVPVADERLGLPYTAGFRVELETAVPSAGSEFPVTYFAADARRGSAALVAQKKLNEGDTFYYQLLAFPQTSPPPTALARPSFDVTEEMRPIIVIEKPLAPLLAGSVLAGDGDRTLPPVFLPEAVLDEAQDLTEQAGAREVGGILLGRLHRDAGVPEIGVVVTAQIPARHALAEADKLTFTPETWAAVEAAIALRRSDEQVLGWWHSHPARYWCAQKNCSAEARRSCSFQLGFFSADDVNLHESVFPKAFHIALLTTHADDGCHHALYGWNRGAIRRRGFRLLTRGVPGAAVRPAARSLQIGTAPTHDIPPGCPRQSRGEPPTSLQARLER